MSVNDLMTLRGRAASDAVAFINDDEGKAFARFRMAVPRVRRRDDGEWEEGEPRWYTVKAWGSLAEHLQLSLRRGAPVVVVGRPSSSAWIAKDGEVRSQIDIHAVTVGHDMVFGLSTFNKLQRAQRAEQQDEGGGAPADEEIGGVELDELQGDEAGQEEAA